MFITTKKEGETYSIPTREVDISKLRTITSDLSFSIMQLLSKKPSYPFELARNLKVHEQKVYYHIRNLQKADLIKVSEKKSEKGAAANYFTLTSPSIFVKFKDFEVTSKLDSLKEQHKNFLEPFIKNGQLDALIIAGSPDPHGPEKARSRDGYYGIDFALFLGTFLNYVPNYNVKLDTEVRTEDLQNNLIIIGGPVVNRITEQVNSKLPIYFDKENNWNITSSISNNVYPADEAGLIVKTKNPFNKDKSILVIAGKRFSGTRASIIAFLKGFKYISSGNSHNKNYLAKVVDGVDLDSDGIIDNIEFRE